MDKPIETSLELCSVRAGYGRTEVLREVSVSVPPGSVVALLGPNGAGKTTTLRVAAGLLRHHHGEVRLDGKSLDGLPPHKRLRAGLCLIPEGRGVFPGLSVKDNLRLSIPPWRTDASVDEAFTAFPILAARGSQLAGTMSGGQQQMLALARTYLAGAKVVMLDEVSTGLAPIVIDQIFESIKQLTTMGVSLLLVEQYVTRALELADSVVLLQHGYVVFDGPPSGLQNEAILAGYLGGVGDRAAG